MPQCYMIAQALCPRSPPEGGGGMCQLHYLMSSGVQVHKQGLVLALRLQGSFLPAALKEARVHLPIPGSELLIEGDCCLMGIDLSIALLNCTHGSCNTDARSDHAPAAISDLALSHLLCHDQDSELLTQLLCLRHERTDMSTSQVDLCLLCDPF